ncbi:hypothetical protein M378DRAFT_16364 [Amanita muscaria Koide BX008]|uniref:Uncharacterized protein n=1 Tax=Amanita muscaria (strain Koide BX008) TaxID=946122 RepID=A0A0C2WM29_AMAMK|nr:hypothetical protein M378DRAFT_16364 [Amanita muscaria Koide BX008]
MNLDTQQDLVVAILQAFLYALYLVSLAHALRWLLYYEEGWTLRSRDQVNWALLTTTFVVFILTTVDLVFRITASQLPFASHKVTHLKMTIAGISIEGATLVLADATLIIRCWLVYQKSWCAVCFPLVLWLGNIISLVLWIVNCTMWAFVSEVPYHQRSSFCLQLYYCLNFVTNFYATSAIVYRVWRVARASTHRHSSILYRICRVVATTGILYTCTSLPLVVAAFLLRKNAAVYNPCDALNFSMAGITFNLFLIRIGQLRFQLSETDVDGSTHNMSESVLLTTVQLGVSTFATNDMQPDANLRETSEKAAVGRDTDLHQAE